MTTTLEKGKLVWLHNPSRKKGLSPKLQRRWEGPYQIVNKLSEIVYRLQRKPGGGKKDVHFDRLKPYEGATPEVWKVSAPDGPELGAAEPSSGGPTEAGQPAESGEGSAGNENRPISSNAEVEMGEQSSVGVDVEQSRVLPRQANACPTQALRRNPSRQRKRPQRYI